MQSLFMYVGARVYFGQLKVYSAIKKSFEKFCFTIKG